MTSAACALVYGMLPQQQEGEEEVCPICTHDCTANKDDLKETVQLREIRQYVSHKLKDYQLI